MPDIEEPEKSIKQGRTSASIVEDDALSILTKDYEGDDEVNESNADVPESGSSENILSLDLNSVQNSQGNFYKRLKPPPFKKPPVPGMSSAALSGYSASISSNSLSSNADEPTKVPFKPNFASTADQIRDKWIKRRAPPSEATMTVASVAASISVSTDDVDLGNHIHPSFSSHETINDDTNTIQPPLSPLTKEEAELLRKLEEQNNANTIRSPKHLKSFDSADEDWEFWGKFLNDMDSTLKKHNKMVLRKIHGNGIPSSIRGTVWNQFVRTHPFSFLKFDNDFKPPAAFAGSSLEDAYVELLKLTSPYEKMIMRDLARTFPKHDFFKNADGIGQESLFNVMKAYSLYDNEVGYCQGLSFIVGALLLHMPDEQAFSCLAHFMNTYQLRNFYTPRMELLQLRLYQFDRLLEELMPRIFNHLNDEGIRSTMYASQWFLTMFSYRLPLEFVFRLMDIVFATGVVTGASGAEGNVMDAVLERVSEVATGQSSTGTTQTKFQEIGSEVAVILIKFALALLKKNEETLISLDFEPLLEFLKNGLFHIYNGEVIETKGHMSRSRGVSKKAIDDLVKDATGNMWKSVTKKKLIALRKEHEEELKQSDPTYLAEKSLEKQNSRLLSDLKRAEKMLAELNKDHCDLAGQLVTVRVELAKEKDLSEALRRQVSDLKAVLMKDLKLYTEESLKETLTYEISEENYKQTPPLPIEKDGARIPSMEEQVEILTQQNIKLLEEAQIWRRRAEQYEKQMKTQSTSGSINAVGTMAAPAPDVWNSLRRFYSSSDSSSTKKQ